MVSPQCGGPIVLDGGNYTYVNSPGYPGSYANHLNCEWIVQTSADMRIKLTIVRMQLGTYIHKKIPIYIISTDI